MVKAPITNLVVAVSGSQASIGAAKYAVVTAKLYKCSLTAVYVIDTATLKQLMMSKIFVIDESREYEMSLRANGERYLSFIRELADAKGVHIETELREGSIPTQILAVANERHADLIVLGGWEKDRPARDIISRDHLDIMMHANCSVIVTKEPDIDLIYRNC
jgi:nucleotide-binding universal stress UspA family protein